MRAISVPKGLAVVLCTLVLATCGRTDLELGGTGGRRVVTDAGSDSARDAARDSVADANGTGGMAASGGRGMSTGGRVGSGGSGGRMATGGAASGGRPGSGGMPSTGGRPGTGGRASGGAPGTGGRMATGGATDGGVRDAAADRPPADAGPDLPPSTPGTLMCGAQSCDVKTQTCCVSLAVGSVGARCIPIGTDCTGAALVCDEPADCPGGICCFGLQTGGGTGVGIGSMCSTRAACNGFGRFVVCRTNADCGGTTPACCTLGGVPVCQIACLGN